MAAKKKKAAAAAAPAVVEASVEETLERLTSAERRLKAQEWAPAFDDLLAAWRGLRSGAIAALVDALSRRAARGKEVAKKSETQLEHVTKWSKMFQERSDLGLGVLLADLQAVIEGSAQPRFVVPRIEGLVAVHDDPRISMTLIPVFRHFGWGGQWDKVFLRSQRALEAAADPRTVLLLEAVAAPNERWKTRIVEAMKKKNVAEEPPPLPDELEAIVKSIEKLIQTIPEATVIDTPAREKPKGADPAALLEQVRQSPDDDELRLVLADALDAAGDPQGELIVLQIRRAQGESNAKTWARERLLLKTYMKTWLGALAPVVKLKSAVFERGFLERCTAVARRQVDAQVHFQHEEWATVRSITFENEARITPAMRSLREALNVNGQGISQLMEHGHPTLERLGLTTWGGGFDELATCPKEKLPNLKHLDVNGYVSSMTQLDWIWDTPWTKQLKIFGITSRVIGSFADVLLAHDHLDEVRVDSQVGYEVRYQRVPNDPKRVIFKLRFIGETAFTGYNRTQLTADLKEIVNKSSTFNEIIIEVDDGRPIESSFEKIIRDWLLLFKRPIQVTVPFNLVQPP